MNILFEIIVYTFAIFGIIVFVQETIGLFKIQPYGRLILVLKDEDNIEQILRDYLKVTKYFKKIYIFFEGNDDLKEEIIKLFCSQNSSLHRIDNEGFIVKH